jgi:hypothetical protein
MKRIAVDFDDTLISADEKGRPIPLKGGAESLKILRESGFEIVIYSCRTGIAAREGRLHEEIEWMKEVLDHFEIPFDSIFAGDKIIADVYIDDRAIHFNGDWEETVSKAFDYLNWKKESA